MANTYSQLYIHIIFAVKGRQSLIHEHLRVSLEKYITAIVSAKRQRLMAVYCMPDHCHLFISMAPNISISDLVRDVKANSSRFLSEGNFLAGRFSWQEGFGAFSYAQSQLDTVVKYILNQPLHHKQSTFKAEYLQLLQKFKIDYDEQYLFDWIEM